MTGDRMTTGDHTCPATDLALASPDEHDARVMVASYLDARVVQIDRRGGPDFCIEKGGTHVGILEVTRETDEDWRRQEAQLKSNGWVFHTALIDGSWQLDLEASAIPMKLDMARVAELISKIDSLGLESFPTGNDPESEVVLDLMGMGVSSGYRREEPGGFIYFGTPGIRSWSGLDHVSDAVIRHIDANRAKLEKGPGERHLFLWIESHSIPAWFQVIENELPDGPPPLEDVDVIWVCAQEKKTGTHLWCTDKAAWTILR